jgi:hypothetical protein
MKVRVIDPRVESTRLYDCGKSDAVMLIFKDDAERIRVANQILNMPAHEGVRIWCQCPDGKGDAMNITLLLGKTAEKAKAEWDSSKLL